MGIWTSLTTRTGYIVSADIVQFPADVEVTNTRVEWIPESSGGRRGVLPAQWSGTAAAELFARQGYDSTSTRSLATLLGMEKATLYYHVESKEDLLYVICKSSIEQITSDVNEAISGVDDPLEQLLVLIQAHVASLLRERRKA